MVVLFRLQTYTIITNKTSINVLTGGPQIIKLAAF